MNKKGELTSSQIVMIVLAIFGFIILVIFAIRFLEVGNESVNREACHLSVIKRATLDTNFGNFQEGVPLDCETEKICITTSGKREACKEFAGFDKVRVVKISNSDEDAPREIEEISANAMYDCWSMMGEGKLDLFGKFIDTFGVDQPMCVICSRVVVADDVSSEVREKVDVNNYLRTRQVPGFSFTYLQAFTDRSINSYAGITEGGDFIQFPEDFNDMAFVFAQIKTRDPIDSALKTGGFVAGAALLGPAGRLAITPLGAIAILTGIGTTSAIDYLTAKRSQVIAAGYCGDFESAADVKQGCSVVKGLQWDASAINSFCSGGIQGRL